MVLPGGRWLVEEPVPRRVRFADPMAEVKGPTRWCTAPSWPSLDPKPEERRHRRAQNRATEEFRQRHGGVLPVIARRPAATNFVTYDAVLVETRGGKPHG